MNTARKQIVREDLYPSRIEPHPVWIGRQDPVVHSQWRPNAPISETDSQSFARDGYLVLDGAFAPEEIAALEQELARLRAAPDALMRDTLVMEPDADDALRSIFSVHTQSALFRALAHDERLVAIARYLLGDEVYIHQSRLNYKPGFTGKEFYWHSDFETWHIEDGMPRMRALSMSLLLSENTANNGPLMLMPGSHMHYVACVGETPENHYKQSLRKQEYGVPDHESLAKLAKDGIAAPLGAPGSLVIFDCNTMHGSNGNITPLPRANAFIVFNAVSNAIGAPFGAVAPRPEFIAAREDQAPITPRRGSLAGLAKAA